MMRLLMKTMVIFVKQIVLDCYKLLKEKKRTVFVPLVIEYIGSYRVFKILVAFIWFSWVFTRLIYLPAENLDSLDEWGWLGKGLNHSYYQLQKFELGWRIEKVYYILFQHHKEEVEETLLQDWKENFEQHYYRWAYTYYMCKPYDPILELDYYLYCIFGILYEVYYLFFTYNGKETLFWFLEKYLGEPRYQSGFVPESVSEDVAQKNEPKVAAQSESTVERINFIKSIDLFYTIDFYITKAWYPISHLIDRLFCLGLRFYFLMKGQFIVQLFDFYLWTPFLSYFFYDVFVDLIYLFETLNYAFLVFISICITPVLLVTSPIVFVLVGVEGGLLTLALFLLNMYRYWHGIFTLKIFLNFYKSCKWLGAFFTKRAFIRPIKIAHKDVIDLRGNLLGEEKAYRWIITAPDYVKSIEKAMPRVSGLKGLFSPFLFLLAWLSTFFITSLGFETLLLDSVYGAFDVLWDRRVMPATGIGGVGYNWGPDYEETYFLRLNLKLEPWGSRWFAHRKKEYYFWLGEFRSLDTPEGFDVKKTQQVGNLKDLLTPEQYASLKYNFLGRGHKSQPWPSDVPGIRAIELTPAHRKEMLNILASDKIYMESERFRKQFEPVDGRTPMNAIRQVALTFLSEGYIDWEWDEHCRSVITRWCLGGRPSTIQFLPEGQRRDIQLNFFYLCFWGYFLFYTMNNYSFYSKLRFWPYGRVAFEMGWMIVIFCFTLVFDRLLSNFFDSWLSHFFLMHRNLSAFSEGTDDDCLQDGIDPGQGRFMDIFRASTGNPYHNPGLHTNVQDAVNFVLNPAAFEVGGPEYFVGGFNMLTYMNLANVNKLNFLPSYFSPQDYELVPHRGYGEAQVSYPTNLLDMLSILGTLNALEVEYSDLFYDRLVGLKRPTFKESQLIPNMKDYREVARRALIESLIKGNPGWAYEDSHNPLHEANPHNPFYDIRPTSAPILHEEDYNTYIAHLKSVRNLDAPDAMEAELIHYGAVDWQEFEYLHYRVAAKVTKEFGKHLPHSIYGWFANWEQGIAEKQYSHYPKWAKAHILESYGQSEITGNSARVLYLIKSYAFTCSIDDRGVFHPYWYNNMAQYYRGQVENPEIHHIFHLDNIYRYRSHQYIVNTHYVEHDIKDFKNFRQYK